MRSPEENRGVSRERTGLAWERSAFSFATLAGVVLGIAAHRDVPELVAVALALLAVAAAVWRHSRAVYRATDVAPQPEAMRLLTLAAVGLALVVVVTVLLHL
jgi:uncharacterized membrane protein YidH (DUF202 family)